MCDCQNSTTSFGTVTAPANCSDITTDTLDLYIRLIQCVADKGAYAATQTNSLECGLALEKLQQWKEAKTHAADSCRYIEYLPIMQDLITRIILSGSC